MRCQIPVSAAAELAAREPGTSALDGPSDGRSPSPTRRPRHTGRTRRQEPAPALDSGIGRDRAEPDRRPGGRVRPVRLAGRPNEPGQAEGPAHRRGPGQSAIINLGKEATVKLIVKNESNVDASGVSLVYQLPEALKINSSTPEATPIPGDKPLFHWAKPMLAAGGEWVVVLKVVAISAKACEHAATVTAKTGSRANTIVQEPKLKVEATSSPGRVLKGEQVKFDIAVQNTGTGPARNVIVQAKLSSGLRQGSDDIVEQTISEIGPGQRVDLEPLWVDTVAGGQQTCTVDVRSPDVNPVVEDQRITRKVEVTTPALTVKLEGQAERFTGQTNEYKLSVKNPGTAPAKKVKVAVTLPKEGGQMIGRPAGAKFVLQTRQLLWSIAQLEPGQTVDMSFNYGTSTPGLYRASAEVTSGELRATDTMTTDVSGIAVLDLQVSQESRVMDVGKDNYYDITIKNVGTKEATKLLLSGKLTPNLTVVEHFNVDKGDFVFAKDGDKRRHQVPLPGDRAPRRRPDDHPEPESPGDRERARRLPRLPRARRDGFPG